MNDIIQIYLAGIAGLVLGTLFFGGLWFTVKKLVTSKTPALWFIVSLLLRVSITMIGFYFITAGSWQRLTACLVGFIAARFLVVYFTKLLENKNKQVNQSTEVNHEV